MKIRFIKTFSSNREVFKAGNDYDIDNSDAIRYIEAGIARKTAEPSTPEPAVQAAPSPLKPGEKIGEDADKPEATPIPTDIPPAPANNPAAFMHADGTVTKSTGFTTSDPDETTSPRSDQHSPVATNTGHEAVTTTGKTAAPKKVSGK